MSACDSSNRHCVLTTELLYANYSATVRQLQCCCAVTIVLLVESGVTAWRVLLLRRPINLSTMVLPRAITECSCCWNFRWLVKCCFTSTETVGLLGTGAQDGHLDFHTAPELWIFVGWVLLYVHRNRRLIRDGSPGRPPRLSHSSWALNLRDHVALRPQKRVCLLGTVHQISCAGNLMPDKMHKWMIVLTCWELDRTPKTEDF